MNPKRTLSTRNNHTKNVCTVTAYLFRVFYVFRVFRKNRSNNEKIRAQSLSQNSSQAEPHHHGISISSSTFFPESSYSSSSFSFSFIISFILFFTDEPGYLKKNEGCIKKSQNVCWAQTNAKVTRIKESEEYLLVSFRNTGVPQTGFVEIFGTLLCRFCDSNILNHF